MKPLTLKIIFLLGYPAILLLSVAWMVVTMRARTLGLCLVVATLLLHSFSFLHRRFAITLIAWLIFLGSTFLSFDISLKNYPGPPRFVPVVMGTPSKEALAAERRGEIALGGCVVYGTEPKWVWIW